MINIRRAQHRDALQIMDSHVRSIREICFKNYTSAQIEAWAGRKIKESTWCQSIDRDLIWVIEINNIVSGFGHLAVMDERTAEILGLYFAPEACGLGIGKNLFSLMMNQAQSIGVKQVELLSTLTAKTFYEQFGFMQVEGESSIGMQGVQIPCIPMKALIDS